MPDEYGDTKDPADHVAGDVTLASYEAAADRYMRESARPGAATLAFLDQFR